MVSLWWEVAGEGSAPPLVLIHGSMDRAAGLLRLSRRLDSDRPVVRYDRRGYGRSRSVGPPWTVAANIDDLEALLDERSRDPAVLFGHSFGGNVALGLADRRPDLVDAVIVYETPLSWIEWWPGDSAGGAAVANRDPGDGAEAFMRRLVGDAAWERLPQSKRQARRSEGAALVGELADLRREAPWRAERVRVPVLALYGETGRPHHRAAMDSLAKSLPDGRVQMVPDAGHAGPHTHADAVADAVAGFITGRRSAPTPGD